MKPVPFEYCRPDTVAEAIDLLAEFRGEASVLAGGMSLGPMLNLRLVRPRAVVDVTRIAALRVLDVRNQAVVTGATVCQADALASRQLGECVPLLHLALPWVGHFQTRNRGTLGGSVAHADPSAEVPLSLVTLGGHVVLRSRRGERRISAQEFFLGALSTARLGDELVVALEWPLSIPGTRYGFAEFAERHGDFAIASVACALRLGGSDCIAELSLGVGGVEDRPLAVDTRQFVGQAFQPEEIAQVVVRTLSPIEDRVASVEYRRELARVLIGRALRQAKENGR